MDMFEISVEKREVTGKGAMRRLKREGFIPGVLYNNDESIPVLLNERDLSSILNKYGDDVTLSVDYNGTPMKTRIREVQRDPVTREIQHIDLMPVDPDKQSDKTLH